MARPWVLDPSSFSSPISEKASELQTGKYLEGNTQPRLKKSDLTRYQSLSLGKT
jgi:hypothetical protein